jgi:hypothetical protein
MFTTLNPDEADNEVFGRDSGMQSLCGGVRTEEFSIRMPEKIRRIRSECRGSGDWVEKDPGDEIPSMMRGLVKIH